MQPTRSRSLHRFDARSLVLFASLTMGGTQAVMAQNLHPTPQSHHPAPTSAVVHVAQATPDLPQPTPAQVFDRADANGDGKLTLREAERYPAVAEQFDRFDLDKNGSLSREEFTQGIGRK